MMEIVYFTLAALVLYVGSDWILNRIETARGARFKNRSLVFFIIILVLSVSSFSIIEYLSTQQAKPGELHDSGRTIQNP